MTLINIVGLATELAAASIQFSGCNAAGVVWDLQNNEIQARPDVAAVITAHNAASWDSLQLAWGGKCPAARLAAKAIPNWATWSQADWAAWYNANMSATQINAEATLADAKVVQNKMATAVDALAKMVIALRDCTWPDLPDR